MIRANIAINQPFSLSWFKTRNPISVYILLFRVAEVTYKTRQFLDFPQLTQTTLLA